jgi:hypothetical protein
MVRTSHRPVRKRASFQLPYQTRCNRAFRKDPKVPTGASGTVYMQGEVFDTPSASRFPTWQPGLGNLQANFSRRPAVADANVQLSLPGDSKVFSESSKW